MKTITVLNRQNLLDVALKQYGKATAVFKLALENKINITGDLKANDTLVILSDGIQDKELVDFYYQKEVEPATAIPLIIEDEKHVYGLP